MYVCITICFLLHVLLKWHTINMICKCPKLSDQKVENMTKMVKPFKPIVH